MSDNKRKEFFDSLLVSSFIEDMDGEPTDLVITGIEQIGGFAPILLSCVLELYNEVKKDNAEAPDFKLKLVCDSRSATFE